MFYGNSYWYFNIPYTNNGEMNMEVRIKGKPEFVRAILNKNDIFLQLESANLITSSWLPFTPDLRQKHIIGMVKKTHTGIILMNDFKINGEK